MKAGSPFREALGRFVLSYGLLMGALAIECIVFELIARKQGLPPFLSDTTLMLVLKRSAVYGVMCVGMTFVIISGGIDLSVGSMLAFGGVVCAKVVQVGGLDAGWGWISAGYAAALMAGAAAGLFAGTLITWFRIPPFIATLALMSSLRGLGYIMADGKPVAPLPKAYQVLGREHVASIVPISVIVMLAVVAAGAVLLNHTRFGRHVRAIGGNEESARLSGVNVNTVKLRVYAMCSTLAVLSGLVLSSKLGSGSPKVGLGDELQVIAAVVVGGTSLSGGRGTIGGTFLGLLIVSVLNSGLNWIGVETFGQQVILGAVILCAVLLDRIKG